jgi:flagellar biosynthesis protein FliQ
MDDMDLRVIELARELLLTTMLIAGPVLLLGLVVGVSVSLFQALTSVQEQTMSLVPKMVAVVSVTMLMLAPAIGLLRDFCLKIFGELHSFGLS